MKKLLFTIIVSLSTVSIFQAQLTTISKAAGMLALGTNLCIYIKHDDNTFKIKTNQIISPFRPVPNDFKINTHTPQDNALISSIICILNGASITGPITFALIGTPTILGALSAYRENKALDALITEKESLTPEKRKSWNKKYTEYQAAFDKYEEQRFAHKHL